MKRDEELWADNPGMIDYKNAALLIDASRDKNRFCPIVSVIKGLQVVCGSL